MKYRPATQLATIGNAQSARQFKISPKNFAKVASILSGLYPHPIPAVVREYLTNARDSHLSAGQTRPIEITLDRNVFVVEDYGVGLTISELEDIWTEYGESSKEDDEDQTGALGLGSKSAFSYTDLFTVTSRHNGVQAVGINSKDSSGVPEFEIVDTASTTEPNGVRVEIPIQSQDYGRFDDAISELLTYWPSGSVLVNGEPNESIADTDTKRLVLDPEVTLYRTNGTSVLVSGGVPYEVPDHRLGLPYTEKIVAHIPLGLIDFTPARELEYSDKTVEVIDDLRSYIKERKEQVFQEMLDNAPTPWDGLVAMSTWSQRNVLQGRFRYFTVKVGYKRRGYGFGTIASKGEGQIAVSTLADANIIVGFPRKSVSERHKEILEHHDLHSNAVLVPATVASQIEGHPKVYSWKDLVASAPKPERAKRESGAKTEYIIFNAAGYQTTVTEGDDHGFDNLYFAEGNPSDGVSTVRIPALQELGIIPPGTVGVAVIWSRSVDKFRRLYPEVKRYHPAISSERIMDRVKKASPETIAVNTWLDKKRYSSLGGFGEYVSSDPSRIADPELRELVENIHADRDDVPEYDAIANLGYTHYIPEADGSLSRHIDKLVEAPKRYALLSVRNVDEDAAEAILTAINNEYRLRTLQGL